MWRHPLLKIALFAYVAWGGWHWFSERPISRPDGILAADDPSQGEVFAPGGPLSSAPLRIGRWTLTPRAPYRITARVLSVARYHFDALAAVIPEDLVLGWGPMSDSSVLRTLEISQSNRFYYWRRPGDGLPKEVIISHSANTHVIPADASVGRQLSRLRPGQVVVLNGELVDAVRDDGAWIKTSLSRTDSGAGACEVLLVQDVAVVP